MDNYYSPIKQSTIDSITRYVENGIDPGGFVTAVLENNLSLAMGRADQENREALFYICSYVHNEIPGSCHGSTEAVKQWLKHHKEK